eukprot:gnl/Chilomastix_caulleri/4508.p1 GENE.gnl/Chilomastix_caulleri/4508~~gnl/Chilomastix_caulleri/4508.p1  ORF type:complete len:88 (+),score=40.26 gnl/Chilomastix_caulleri/4508:31-294(+)
MSTTMNPNRAQPLSRGQQNNPFAGLVDMAPSAPSAPAVSMTTTTTSPMGMGMGMSAPAASNPMGSMFSSSSPCPTTDDPQPNRQQCH